MAYNVYSLPDCKSVLYHPDVGTANLALVLALELVLELVLESAWR